MEDKYKIREIFQMFYLSYRDTHTVTQEQESTAQCIMGCKTGAYGYTVSVCPDCGKKIIHNASCGNRNCPSCQGTKPEEWVQARSSELVEGLPYFHVIMTLPHELNPLCLSNPAVMYRLLMQSANAALLESSSRSENLEAVSGLYLYFTPGDKTGNCISMSTCACPAAACLPRAGSSVCAMTGSSVRKGNSPALSGNVSWQA